MRLHSLFIPLPVVALGLFGWSMMAPMPPASAAGESVAAKPPSKELNRDAYLKDTEGQFEQWGKKIDQFRADAKRKSEMARREANQKLDTAWAEVKENWQSLKVTTQDGWTKAKSSFEDSWRRLEAAWKDATTEG